MVCDTPVVPHCALIEFLKCGLAHFLPVKSQTSRESDVQDGHPAKLGTSLVIGSMSVDLYPITEYVCRSLPGYRRVSPVAHEINVGKFVTVDIYLNIHMS